MVASKCLASSYSLVSLKGRELQDLPGALEIVKQRLLEPDKRCRGWW